jgi:hypothetical protein
MHYSTASRRDDGTRHVSVHRVALAPSPRFLATCHDTDRLKWFRLAGVSNARLDPSVPFRPASAEAIAKIERETVGGFHEDGAPVACSFFVRQPEAAWVKRNLLNGMTHESTSGGIRVSIDTAAVQVVARFVVQLGEAARAETPELRAQVEGIAKGALRNAAE